MAEASLAQRTKTCTACRMANPASLEYFGPHKLGKYKLHPLCRLCKKADDAQCRNRPDQKARQKRWRDANREYARLYNAEYRKTYTSTADVKAWKEKNLEHARAQARESHRRRRATSPAFRLKERLSARLNRMVRDKNSRRTEDLLGFTRDKLKRHIERQFTSGMTWGKVAAGLIHIDHILPVAFFNITSVDDPDFKVCWALTNLRPMWKEQNMSKGGKRLHLL